MILSLVWKRRRKSTKVLKAKSKKVELTFAHCVFGLVWFFYRWNEEWFIYHCRKRRIWERREKCGQKCGSDNACRGQQWSNFKGIFVVCFSLLQLILIHFFRCKSSFVALFEEYKIALQRSCLSFAGFRYLKCLHFA